MRISTIFLVLLLMGLGLPLRAQLFTVKSPKTLAGASFVPHVFAAVQDQVAVQLNEKLLEQTADYELFAATLLLGVEPVPFPGSATIQDRSGLMKTWMEKEGRALGLMAAALSQPLERSTKAQSIRLAEKVPEDLYEQLDIEWPKEAQAKVIHLEPAGERLTHERVWKQAPRESRFAVVVLLAPMDPETRAVPTIGRYQPVMLIFF